MLTTTAPVDTAWVLCSVEERIATVTLNRPEKRNALSLALMRELTSTLREIGANRDIAVVILTWRNPEMTLRCLASVGASARAPALTVVAQPAYEIGQTAGELLVTADADRPARHVVLPPTLVVRESSIRNTAASGEDTC